jgi:hypothetical protein
MHSFLGNLLVCLRHAREISRRVGIVGALRVEMIIDGIRGVPWIYAKHNRAEKGPSSLLDNATSFVLEISSEDLLCRTDGVAMDIIEQVFFSMNWPQLVGNRDGLRNLIHHGYLFNSWGEPNELEE